MRHANRAHTRARYGPSTGRYSKMRRRRRCSRRSSDPRLQAAGSSPTGRGEASGPRPQHVGRCSQGCAERRGHLAVDAVHATVCEQAQCVAARACERIDLADRHAVRAYSTAPPADSPQAWARCGVRKRESAASASDSAARATGRRGASGAPRPCLAAGCRTRCSPARRTARARAQHTTRRCLRVAEPGCRIHQPEVGRWMARSQVDIALLSAARRTHDEIGSQRSRRIGIAQQQVRAVDQRSSMPHQRAARGGIASTGHASEDASCGQPRRATRPKSPARKQHAPGMPRSSRASEPDESRASLHERNVCRGHGAQAKAPPHPNSYQPFAKWQVQVHGPVQDPWPRMRPGAQARARSSRAPSDGTAPLRSSA